MAVDRPAAELWKMGDEHHRGGLGRDRDECIMCDQPPPCEYELAEREVRRAKGASIPNDYAGASYWTPPRLPDYPTPDTDRPAAELSLRQEKSVETLADVWEDGFYADLKTKCPHEGERRTAWTLGLNAEAGDQNPYSGRVMSQVAINDDCWDGENV